MARTKRYDAMRRYIAEADEKVERKQSRQPKPDGVKQGTEKWILSVVGPLKLCPFAPNLSATTVLVCNFSFNNDDGQKANSTITASTATLKDYAWLV